MKKSMILFNLALALGVLLSSQISAQVNTPPNAPAKPIDAKALMQQAVLVNGLAGEQINPWHIRVSYKLLDDSGKPLDQGVYEEYWVSPKKFVRSFTGSTYMQVFYGTEKGMLRTGVAKLPFELISDVRREFADPMPFASTVQYFPFDLQERAAGESKFDCLSLNNAAIFRAPVNLIGHTYCFEKDRPVLHISASTPEMAQFIHVGTENFQERFIPKDVKGIKQGKAVLEAHLEQIEMLNTIDDKLFAPSSEAVSVPRKIVISGAVAQGLLVKHRDLVYPKGAQGKGTVIVGITIDQTGHVADVHYLAGPSDLRDAALDCVRGFLYRPYLLNGESIEVETTVNLVF